MGFLIRAERIEHLLTNEPITLGCAQRAAICVEGTGAVKQ